MTDVEKFELLMQMTSETDNDMLSTYLLLAKEVVLQKAYPFGEYPEQFPSRYDTVHVESAAYMLNKRGAEGETAHTATGVSRYYENGDIPLTLLRRIVPQAGVL